MKKWVGYGGWFRLGRGSGKAGTPERALPTEHKQNRLTWSRGLRVLDSDLYKFLILLWAWVLKAFGM